MESGSSGDEWAAGDTSVKPKGAGMVWLGLILMVVSGFLALNGGAGGQTITNGPVRCGQQTMSPGDSCHTYTRRGLLRTRTYEEQLAIQRRTEDSARRWQPFKRTAVPVGLAGGAVLFVVGNVRLFRRGRSDDETPVTESEGVAEVRRNAQRRVGG